MVLNIQISAEQWVGVVIDRNSFNDFIINHTFPCLMAYNDIEKTIFKLPSSVTKLERYNIHKLTVTGFDPESYDRNNERVMDITFSKNYIQKLFENYQFPIQVIVETPVQVIQKTDKQILFENLMNFIETNLANEFQQFLNTI